MLELELDTCNISDFRQKTSHKMSQQIKSFNRGFCLLVCGSLYFQLSFQISSHHCMCVLHCKHRLQHLFHVKGCCIRGCDQNISPVVLTLFDILSAALMLFKLKEKFCWRVTALSLTVNISYFGPYCLDQTQTPPAISTSMAAPQCCHNTRLTAKDNCVQAEPLSSFERL